MPFEPADFAAARQRGGGRPRLVTCVSRCRTCRHRTTAVPPRWTRPRCTAERNREVRPDVTRSRRAARAHGIVEVDLGRYARPATRRRSLRRRTVAAAARRCARRTGPSGRDTAADHPACIRTCYVDRPGRTRARTVLDLLVERFAAEAAGTRPAVSAYAASRVAWARAPDGGPRERSRRPACQPGSAPLPVVAGRGGGVVVDRVAARGATGRRRGVTSRSASTCRRRRAEYVLREVGATTVLADRAGAELLRAELDVDLVRMSASTAADRPGGPVSHRERPAAPCRLPGMLLYTSGTTGRPKGILIPHRGLLNTAMWWAEEAFGLGPANRGVLCTWSTQFDCRELRHVPMPALRCPPGVVADDVERARPGRLAAAHRAGRAAPRSPR